MASRKPIRRKGRSSRKRNKRPVRNSLSKAIAALVIVAALVTAVGYLVYHLTPPQKPARSSSAAKPAPTRQAPVSKPTFEIYPQEKTPDIPPLAKIDIPKPVPAPRPVPLEKLPLAALIVDDLGYDKKIAEKFLELDATLTFSILPHSPFENEIAHLASSKGLEIMLHLPMEPVEYPDVNPGPGTLLSSMSPDELIRQLEDDLSTLPGIKGVNNHMGSKLTSESTQMYQIFSILKQRGLFFIDSRTTADSMGRPSARLFQIPFAERDVFIDHYQKPDFIRKQFKELIRKARLKGYAVGILHPHSTTYQILRETLPDLQNQVQLVSASKIVHPVE
jgi:polysaccharide deacetylase 2 family uncharacterized protein YibQ